MCTASRRGVVRCPFCPLASAVTWPFASGLVAALRLLVGVPCGSPARVALRALVWLSAVCHGGQQGFCAPRSSCGVLAWLVWPAGLVVGLLRFCGQCYLSRVWRDTVGFAAPHLWGTVGMQGTGLRRSQRAALCRVAPRRPLAAAESQPYPTAAGGMGSLSALPFTGQGCEDHKPHNAPKGRFARSTSGRVQSLGAPSVLLRP